MDRGGRLFSEFNEGFEPAHAPRRRLGPRTTQNQVTLPTSASREEELWTGAGRLFAAVSTVYGDGI